MFAIYIEILFICFYVDVDVISLCLRFVGVSFVPFATIRAFSDCNIWNGQDFPSNGGLYGFYLNEEYHADKKRQSISGKPRYVSANVSFDVGPIQTSSTAAKKRVVQNGKINKFWKHTDKMNGNDCALSSVVCLCEEKKLYGIFVILTSIQFNLARCQIT